jgi:hypothetical protein
MKEFLARLLEALKSGNLEEAGKVVEEAQAEELKEEADAQAQAEAAAAAPASQGADASAVVKASTGPVNEFGDPVFGVTPAEPDAQREFSSGADAFGNFQGMTDEDGKKLSAGEDYAARTR